VKQLAKHAALERRQRIQQVPIDYSLSSSDSEQQAQELG
jgi:hypothetical protein